jgi:hypothetical protein
LGALGQDGFDFATEWDQYGLYTDYGGYDFTTANDLMPFEEVPDTSAGQTTWEPFTDYGQPPEAVPWPENAPVWNWSAPNFNPADAPAVSGEGGTVTSTGVGPTMQSGGGLSFPSFDSIAKLLQTGVQVYGQVTQAQTQQAIAEAQAQRGYFPSLYPNTMLPGVPGAPGSTSTPMVWNPQTNRYEPARTLATAGQILPGVSNTILIAGAAGVLALLMLGGKKGK